MKEKSKSNLYSGLVVTLLGVFYYISSLSIRITRVGGAFHSRMVPQWIAILLIIMGAILISRDIIPWIKSRKSNEVHESATGAERKKSALQWLKSQKDVFLIFFVSFAYVGLMDLVGFRISTPIFLFSFIVILSPHKTKKHYFIYAGVSVLITMILYLLFRYGFNMMLPRGILF